MAKQRTLNEIRQSKEYQIARKTAGSYEDCVGEVKTLSDQGGEYTVPSKGADPIPIKNPFEHDEVLELVDKIVDKLQPQVFDLIFEAVNDEMSNYYTFQASNYLTEAGEELFEDQWFEFYYENHGKIMHKLLQNLK